MAQPDDVNRENVRTGVVCCVCTACGATGTASATATVRERTTTLDDDRERLNSLPENKRPLNRPARPEQPQAASASNGERNARAATRETIRVFIADSFREQVPGNKTRELNRVRAFDATGETFFGSRLQNCHCSFDESEGFLVFVASELPGLETFETVCDDGEQNFVR